MQVSEKERNKERREDPTIKTACLPFNYSRSDMWWNKETSALTAAR
jgi:hypothetical protein